MLSIAQMQFTWSLIFLASCLTPSVLAVNITNICALTDTNTKLADPHDCSNFYTCTGGLAQLQTCPPPNKYFSKDQQKCVPLPDANCLGNAQDPCLGHDVGTWVGVPGSCSGFYYCSANGAMRGDCPPGLNFDPYSQDCKYSTNYPCGTESAGGQPANDINLCSYIPNGLYFGSPVSCAAWNQCVKNVMRTGLCTDELVFNVNLHTCDYPNRWPCSQVTNDPDLSGSAVNGEPCSDNDEMKPATACRSYYQCKEKVFRLKNCPGNLYYDPPSKMCVNRLNARNDCDRCAGSTDEFVNQYSTQNCTGYLYCVNGVEKGKGTCKVGYFDEVFGGCIKDDQPEYGCCNPSVYATTVAPPTTAQETTNSEEPTTKEGESTTQTPEATTQTPEPTTEAPEATTETPEATTETPEATTETPEATTETPEPTTDKTEPTTETPEPTTETPEATTETPEPTTETPEATTETPEATTETPEPTTETPEPTTEEPEKKV